MWPRKSAAAVLNHIKCNANDFAWRESKSECSSISSDIGQISAIKEKYKSREGEEEEIRMREREKERGRYTLRTIFR